MVLLKRIRVITIVMFTIIFFVGCKSDDYPDEMAQREFEQRLQAAQELARQIREGGMFDEDAIRKEKIVNPDNICSFTIHYWAVDFGANPEFRLDGQVAIYDSQGIIYYYDLIGKQRYNIFQFGRHPSFGMFQEEGLQRYVFQQFDRVMTERGRETIIRGLKMNTEATWMQPPKTLYEGNASNPYLVNDDKNVIFKKDNQHYLLDENLRKSEISQDEYVQLRDSRYHYKNQWKVKDQYRGIKGLWITDLNEKNWLMMRKMEEMETVIIIPENYSIYYWGSELAGVFEIIPTETQKFSIKLDNNMTASVGDLFDVYEKRISPISQEVIGYDQERFKGTLRVVDIIDGYYICEYQTRIHMQGMFKDDIAVLQRDNSILGRLL